MSTMEKCCRMCHQNSGVLVSPCRCEGSMKYVHSKCLSDWVFFHRSLSCEVCGVTYSVAKVLGYRPSQETHEKVVLLLSICIRRYTRKSLEVFLPFFFRVLALMSVPLIFACFYSIQVFFFSRILSWHSLTPLLACMGGLKSEFSFAMGMELALLAFPFFFLWEAWREWCASHEEVFGARLAGDSEAEEIITDYTVNDSAGEVDEAQYHWREDHILEPAVLPDDSATILETIDLVQNRLNGSRISERLMSSKLIHILLQFVSFSVFVWVLIGLFPELLHLTVVTLWKVFNGNSFFSVSVEKFFLNFSTSANMAQTRFNMLLSLFDALSSSRMVFWSIAYLSRIFTITIFLSVADRLNRLPYRKTVFSLLIFLRSFLNILMLLFYTVPTFCLLARVFCVDLFTSDASINNGDYDKAWGFLGLSSSNKLENVYSGEKSEVSFFPSPVVTFRALEVLSQNRKEEDGVCWNFMNLHIHSEGNNNFGRNGETLTMNVYGDDSVLFSLFVSTVFVSNVDVSSLVESSYVVAFFTLVALYHVCFIVAATPAKWVGWSCLWNIFRANLFQVMSIIDAKMFLRLYCELCVLSVFVLCVFIRSSLDVIYGVCPTTFMQLLMVKNITTTVGWMRVIFLSYTIPQHAIEVAHNQVISVLSNLFELEEVIQTEPFSLSRLVSRVIRVTAFILCYWAFIIGMVTVCLIPGLYMLYERIGFLRSVLFIFLNIYQCISQLCPDAHILVFGVMKDFFSWAKSSVILMRYKWWYASSFGLLVKQRKSSEEGISIYEVRHIVAIPSSLRSVYASNIQATFLSLDEKEKTTGSLSSLQQTKRVLKFLISNNDAICKLCEEDMSILLGFMKLPGLKSVIRFFLFCTLLLVVLPFIAGSTVVFWLQSILIGPHCYSGPQYLFFFWSWSAGTSVTVFLGILNFRDEKGIGARYYAYYYCGLHYYTTRDTMSFVIIPFFLKLASITIVPCALKNTVVLFLPVSDVVFGESIISLFILTLLVICACIKYSTVMGVVHQFWSSLLGVRGREHPAGVVMDAVASSEGNPLVRQSTENQKEDVPTREVGVEGGIGNTVVMKIDTIKHSCGDAVARVKFFSLTMKEAIMLFLTNVAKKESIVDVFFVDRGEAHAESCKS
ncbi:zinc finger protein [Trypanosoma melophagium]|uniref:zinc finger protein n=1 Tax=Trypanosoma melophagium TaxID=715481 RepID=UPI00351A97D5|nr:zinc finger protein [Trypanosoma melophagium]